MTKKRNMFGRPADHNTPKSETWVLIPSSQADIARLEQHCRQLVKQQAKRAAAVGLVPLPGADIAADLAIFARMVEEINHLFGLTGPQIERLQPQLQAIIYQATLGAGSALIGKVVTRQLLLQILQKTGWKMLARYSGKIVPVAGAVASAAIGYAVFRQLGMQHVTACAGLAQELLQIQLKEIG